MSKIGTENFESERTGTLITSNSPSYEGETMMLYITKDANGKKIFETERKVPLLRKDSPMPQET